MVSSCSGGWNEVVQRFEFGSGRDQVQRIKKTGTESDLGSTFLQPRGFGFRIGLAKNIDSERIMFYMQFCLILFWLDYIFEQDKKCLHLRSGSNSGFRFGFIKIIFQIGSGSRSVRSSGYSYVVYLYCFCNYIVYTKLNYQNLLQTHVAQPASQTIINKIHQRA